MAKQYRIKHGINTAVSLALVVAEHVNEETGETTVVVQDEIFLPGAVLPSNFSPEQAALAEDPESHLYELIEVFDGDSAEEFIPEPDTAIVSPPPVPEVPAPVAEEPAPVVDPQVAETTTVTGDDPATEPAPSITPTPATAQPGEAPVNPFAPTDDGEQ